MSPSLVNILVNLQVYFIVKNKVLVIHENEGDVQVNRQMKPQMKFHSEFHLVMRLGHKNSLQAPFKCDQQDSVFKWL